MYSKESLRDDHQDGPLTGFGPGSLPLEAARSRMIWTPWHSVKLGLAGVGVVLLLPVLIVMSAVIVVLSAIWLIGTIGSYRGARRLEKRARKAQT